MNPEFVTPRMERRICFVNCGLPSHQCACWRTSHADFIDAQRPLGERFERVWDENVEQLYQFEDEA